jgi:hypothetical protein
VLERYVWLRTTDWLEGDRAIERRDRKQRECVCVWGAEQHSRLERGEHSWLERGDTVLERYPG